MDPMARFTAVRFRNYKAFKSYSASLQRFNVLVGPNNSGKSTILGAFRILAEGIRRARARKPQFVYIRGDSDWGYRIDLENLPVSTENVFTDYDETDPARIDFRLSNGNTLRLIFPEVGMCYLVCENNGKPVRTPSDFKRVFPATIGFVPVLGPVEHEEQLYQPEAARQALLTHRASRNFRNIWYHIPEDFDEFRELIQGTWPGMDINPPEVQYGQGKPTLYMFCPEKRFNREIYWAGFGFQVWCQMLTYAIRSRSDSLLVIDEPDIYLHSDLQRQLLALLEGLGPDILIATHSTEIIAESQLGDLLVVNKQLQSAKRLKDPSGRHKILQELGSNMNPTLTRLAVAKRALFIEGKDFHILSTFCRKLGKQDVANCINFAVIPIGGFNPRKVKDLSEGMELTLGGLISKGVILDRDYRSDKQIEEVENELSEFAVLAHIHRRKEIENFLLRPSSLHRAIEARIDEQNRRTGKKTKFSEDIGSILQSITEPLKHEVNAQNLARRAEYAKEKTPGTDVATITAAELEKFEDLWEDLATRLCLVPGKIVFSKLNSYLQESYDIAVSLANVANSMTIDEIPMEIKDLIASLDKFSKHPLPKASN